MIGRREFLQGMGVAGAASAMGYGPKLLAAEAPPETTRIRIIRTPAICFAPLFVAEDLLRAEGFTDVQYVLLLRAGGQPGLCAQESGRDEASDARDIERSKPLRQS